VPGSLRKSHVNECQIVSAGSARNRINPRHARSDHDGRDSKVKGSRAHWCAATVRNACRHDAERWVRRGVAIAPPWMGGVCQEEELRAHMERRGEKAMNAPHSLLLHGHGWSRPAG
jgi:hypothetical protein